jgi:RNA polymerase sigma-70 factor (ECF subfamily)
MSPEEWQSALRAAREAWPDIALPEAVFAAHAEARREQGGALPQHLADLYLACAAANRDPAALRVFDERVLSAVEPAVRKVDTRPAFADELRQLLRVRLLISEDGSPPRIAEYRGGGPLAAWVAVAAVRLALNLKRAERPEVSTDDLMGDLVAREPDPELRHLKGLYRAEYAAALRDSLAALSGRPKALLRLHYVEGVRLARIGALYGVHESTVSRWVAAAVESVGDDTRRRLRERLGLSAGAFDSIARMVASNLELSLSRLLAGAPVGDTTR